MLLLRIAFRNIFRQRRRSILTALSMAGGYLLCAVTLSMLEGSYNNIINIFTLDHTGHIQIHKGNYLRRPQVHKTIDDPESLSELLDKNEAVKSHTLRVFAPALAYSDTSNTPAQVIGVDLNRESQTSRLKLKVTEGKYITDKPDSDGYFEAMIGAGIAHALKIGIDDELILISQGADGSIANDIFKVQGIIGNRTSLDKSKVFLPLVGAQQFLSMPGKVHEIAIVLNEERQTRPIAAMLGEQLPDYSVAPWQVVEETFFKTMESDKKGNYVTIGIVVFIVFIGVLNTVLMSVLERTSEFGVLKAIGSRPMTIAVLITLETSILALLSVIVGLLFTIPLLFWLSYTGIELAQPMDVGGMMFSHMKGELSVLVLGVPMLLVLGFAVLVSIPPGIRAASVSPTRAMGSY